MKKHLALVLALVMVLSSFSFVSAAPDFSDMVGHENEEAVSRLELLNVLKGYPDGTFKPDNTITRAEFAAVAVRVTGLDNVATAAQGLPTGFSDVPAWHWASGYVGTAAKSGIVNGIGNGLFAPETPVKYEEAVTMIVRALGYEPMAEARGGYPFGHLIVANEIDLLDDAMGTQGAWATRGFVAQITDNALEIEMMIQTGYGNDTKWVVSGDEDTDEKYLLDLMGFDTVEGVVTDVDVSDMEVYIDDEDDDDWYNVSEGFDFFMTRGAEIKAWVDGDDVISYTINDDVHLDAVEVDGDEISLVTADKDYDLSRDVDVEKDVEFAKVVINDDGEVSFFEGFDFDGIILVDEIDDDMIVDLNDDEVDVEDFVILKGGETVALEELEEGDLVFYYEDEVLDGEYEGLAIVIEETEIGEIDRVYDDVSFRMNGETYNGAENYTPIYLDEDDLDELTSEILEGMMDEETEVKVFFNLEGDVAFIEGETGVAKTSSFYAVLTGDTVEYNGRRGEMVAFDFLNEFGEEVSYDLEVADLEGTDPEIDNNISGLIGHQQTNPDSDNTMVANELFEVTVDDDGDVTEINILTTEPFNVTNEDADEGFEIDDTYAEINGEDYRLMSGTVVFYDDNDEVITLGEIDDEFSAVDSGEAYVKNGRVEVVVSAETDADTDNTDYTGLVTDVRVLRGGETEVTIEVAGVEMEFVTEDDNVTNIDNVDEDEFWTLTVGDTSEEIEAVAEVTIAEFEVESVDTSADTITLVNSTFDSEVYGNDDDEIELTSDAVIYDAEDDFEELRLRDVKAGDMISVVFDGNSKYWVSYLVVGEVAATVTTEPDVTFDATTSSAILVPVEENATWGRTVNVTITPDVEWDEELTGTITYELNVDKALLNVSGIEVRSLTSEDYSGGVITFTIVLQADVYDGDTLELAEDAITLTATDDNSVQNAMIVESTIDVIVQDN